MKAAAWAKVDQNTTEKMTKMGGIFPILALLPLIYCGLTVAGALAGGSGKVTHAVQSKEANDSAVAEAERHNHEVVVRLPGSGMYFSERRESRRLLPICRDLASN